MSFAYVLSILGWALLAFALTMIAPALVAFGFDETGLALTFLGSAGRRRACHCHAGSTLIGRDERGLRPGRRLLARSRILRRPTDLDLGKRPLDDGRLF